MGEWWPSNFFGARCIHAAHGRILNEVSHHRPQIEHSGPPSNLSAFGPTLTPERRGPMNRAHLTKRRAIQFGAWLGGASHDPNRGCKFVRDSSDS